MYVLQLFHFVKDARRIPANPDVFQLLPAELAGLRRFNVRGLNWADPTFLAERNAIGTAQRVVVERMLEGAASVGDSGGYFENLTTLQLALILLFFLLTYQKITPTPSKIVFLQNSHYNRKKN